MESYDAESVAERIPRFAGVFKPMIWLELETL